MRKDVGVARPAQDWCLSRSMCIACWQRRGTGPGPASTAKPRPGKLSMGTLMAPQDPSTHECFGSRSHLAQGPIGGTKPAHHGPDATSPMVARWLHHRSQLPLGVHELGRCLVSPGGHFGGG